MQSKNTHGAFNSTAFRCFYWLKNYTLPDGKSSIIEKVHSDPDFAVVQFKLSIFWANKKFVSKTFARDIVYLKKLHKTILKRKTIQAQGRVNSHSYEGRRGFEV